jgi:dCTP deaminase
MILSDKRILEEIEKGTIKIEPYNREDLGSNSYDVHLGATLAKYADAELDAKKHNKIESFEIPDEG